MNDDSSGRSLASAERVIALVPMRHHSERVPGKNYRALGGRPLYSHILQALGECPEIVQIVVDTDSPVIREGIARGFPRVRLLDRPEHLRGGEVATNEVLVHDASQVPAPFYLQTHCTNPFITPATVSRAIEAFFDAYPKPVDNRNATPEEQGWPLAFLCSAAASYVSGENLFTDGGTCGGLMTGAIDPSLLTGVPAKK